MSFLEGIEHSGKNVKTRSEKSTGPAGEGETIKTYTLRRFLVSYVTPTSHSRTKECGLLTLNQVRTA